MSNRLSQPWMGESWTLNFLGSRDPRQCCFTTWVSSQGLLERRVLLPPRGEWFDTMSQACWSCLFYFLTCLFTLYHFINCLISACFAISQFMFAFFFWISTGHEVLGGKRPWWYCSQARVRQGGVASLLPPNACCFGQILCILCMTDCKIQWYHVVPCHVLYIFCVGSIRS